MGAGFMSEQQKITFHNGKEVNLQLPDARLGQV
jgi:hypothetical protein